MADERVTVNHPKVHQPGVFHGLSDEEYHGAFALSAHGIKQLRVSPLLYWVNSPLNEDRTEEETEATRVGKAYHARIVEGSKAFESRYVRKLVPEMYPNAVRTNDELFKEIVRLGGRPRAAARKADLIRELLQLNPVAQIWEIIEHEYLSHTKGKIMLDLDLMKSIENAAGMIENHPQLHKAFTGGQPEVSYFWFDPATGVPCKARFDYLKPLAIVDLKTFEGRETNVDRAIARAVAIYKYHIQAAFYLRAALVMEPAVERTFLFVFQQKGVAPIVRGKVLGPGIVMDIGRVAIDQALAKWVECWNRWGSEPWNEMTDVTTFDDVEFPAWIAD